MMSFSSGCNYAKLKTNLRLAINRLKLLEKKKTELALKARKEIAEYISAGKTERARIRVEQIIREDYLVEAMEIIEMYCDLLIARFGLFQSQSQVDPGLEEAISTLIWCAPRLQSDVQELKIIQDHLRLKYGKDYAQACMNNSLSTVSLKVMQKLSVTAPSYTLIELYMAEIAKSFDVAYESAAQHSDNAGAGGSGGGLISFDASEKSSLPDPFDYNPSQGPWPTAPYPTISGAHSNPVGLIPPPLPSQPPVIAPYPHEMNEAPPPPYSSSMVPNAPSSDDLDLPDLPFPKETSQNNTVTDSSSGGETSSANNVTGLESTEVDLDDLSRRFADLKRQQ